VARGHGRHGDAALDVGEHWHGDVAARTDPPLRIGAADRPGVLAYLEEVADALGRAALRRDADHAFAHRYLGSDPLVIVAVAGDRVEPLALLVEQQQHRVLVTEQFGQAVDGYPHERVEVPAPAEPGDQVGQPDSGCRVGISRAVPQGLL